MQEWGYNPCGCICALILIMSLLNWRVTSRERAALWSHLAKRVSRFYTREWCYCELVQLKEFYTHCSYEILRHTRLYRSKIKNQLTLHDAITQVTIGIVVLYGARVRLGVHSSYIEGKGTLVGWFELDRTLWREITISRRVAHKQIDKFGGLRYLLRRFEVGLNDERKADTKHISFRRL